MERIEFSEVNRNELKIKRVGGGKRMKEDDKKEKKLTQLEIDNIIDESINLSILSRLLKLELINEKQFFILKEKIKTFY